MKFPKGAFDKPVRGILGQTLISEGFGTRRYILFLSDSVPTFIT